MKKFVWLNIASTSKYGLFLVSYILPVDGSMNLSWVTPLFPFFNKTQQWILFPKNKSGVSSSGSSSSIVNAFLASYYCYLFWSSITFLSNALYVTFFWKIEFYYFFYYWTLWFYSFYFIFYKNSHSINASFFVVIYLGAIP